MKFRCVYIYLFSKYAAILCFSHSLWRTCLYQSQCFIGVLV